MPTLTRWFIRTSMLFFVLALSLGIWMALRPVPEGDYLDAVFSVYLHLLVFGWLTQLIFGVAYWMFPKLSLSRPHGSPALGWATYGLLNLGLLLRAIAEPLNDLRPGTSWGWLLVLSALLQWLAGLGFVVNSWGRVKER